MGVILNDWKHLLRTETSQKSFLKTFYYNNKGTRKAKDFQSVSNNEIYFTIQSNSIKYNKPLKLISWSSFHKGHHILLKSGLRLLLIGLRNALMDIYF